MPTTRHPRPGEPHEFYDSSAAPGVCMVCGLYADAARHQPLFPELPSVSRAAYQQGRAEGAAAERARLEPELFRLRKERDDARNDAKSYRAIAAYDEGEADGRAAERGRTVAWLRSVASYTNGELTDEQRIAAGVDEGWVVDPIDAIDLADAIERGEHMGGDDE